MIRPALDVEFPFHISAYAILEDNNGQEKKILADAKYLGLVEFVQGPIMEGEAPDWSQHGPWLCVSMAFQNQHFSESQLGKKMGFPKKTDVFIYVSRKAPHAIQIISSIAHICKVIIV